MPKTVKQTPAKKVAAQPKAQATPAKATPEKSVAAKATPVKSAAAKATPEPIVAEPVINVEENITENNAIQTELTQIYKDLADTTTLIRNITQRMRCLEREVKKEGRVLQKLQKKNSKRSTNQAPRGFAKPTRISDEMAKFFGVPIGTEMARTEAAKLIIKYIQNNKLAKEENKKAFQPDKALQSILSPLKDIHRKQDGYTYFNLQHYIGGNFASAANNAKDI